MDENHDGLTQGVLIMWWFNRRKGEQLSTPTCSALKGNATDGLIKLEEIGARFARLSHAQAQRGFRSRIRRAGPSRQFLRQNEIGRDGNGCSVR